MKKSVAIIGSGPSALMLAARLDKNKFDIVIYEKKQAPARKFLVAGEGGFNLTHSENTSDFISRYAPASFFEKIIHSFSNTDLIQWLDSIGIKTYIGTSQRVFPVKGIKPIEVLTAILETLKQKGVGILLNQEWRGWDKSGNLIFFHEGESSLIKPDIIVFALGGASWSITGSDGTWSTLFANKGVEIIPFEPSNCAVGINWPESFIKLAEAKALKNIIVHCGEKEKAGEIVITKFGIEGGAVYALNSEIRKQLKEKNIAEVFVDLKPTLNKEDIEQKIKKSESKKSISDILRNEINLSETSINLLKSFLTKAEFTNTKSISQSIKKLQLHVHSLAPIDEAISTVGGISLNAIDKNFELKKMPGHYAIGEMLDWDAPTGGYLLQACFSMGYCLANHLNCKT